MTWLGPEDLWKTHSRPEAQKALLSIRNMGWSFRPATGHAFGTIKCPYPHHGEGGCTLRIASTSGPLDGSVTANEIKRAQRRCDRLGNVDPARAAARFIDELNQVGECLTAAEQLRDSQSLTLSAEEVMTAAQAGDEPNQESALNQAIDLEGQAGLANTAALISASRFGLADPWPPDEGANELAEAARERLKEVLEGLVDEPNQESQALINDLNERLATFEA